MRDNDMPVDTHEWDEYDWKYFATQLAREYEIVVRELTKDSEFAFKYRFPRLAEAQRAGLL